MSSSFPDPLTRLRFSRRDFLWLLTISAAGTLTGCAENPVSGQRQLILMSEGQEVAIDQEHSPHQFSADYGPMLDKRLNGYLTELGNELASHSHRPTMPYSFRGVNANYVNAYAFPGGSIAVTRGILLELGDEAELAGLLGHEIGHVTARHAAQRMTKGILAQVAVAGASVAVATSEDHRGLAPLVQTLGGLSAGALLARYSRSNEREADDLGMEYAARAGRNPAGMVGLHQMLVEQARRKPNALELMFATHPMSSERLATAQAMMDGKYQGLKGVDRHRERYMDRTAELRRLKPAIEEQQAGEREMAREKFSRADPHLAKSLKLAPEDYTGLILMSKCQFGLGNREAAARFAGKAKEVYPQEPQGLHLSGIISLAGGQAAAAYRDFELYEKMLPGNPNTFFLKGAALESMERQPQAANEYLRYLQAVPSGGQAQYARQRLLDWGVIKAQ
jgi:beta-barrel assembly-enhancing protease